MHILQKSLTAPKIEDMTEKKNNPSGLEYDVSEIWHPHERRNWISFYNYMSSKSANSVA